MSDKNEKIHKLAHDVLLLSRNTLLVNLRFLDRALSRLQYLPMEEKGLMTDGKYILYRPLTLLQSYKEAKENPVRDYLHMVFHCIFRHMYTGSQMISSYWDLACDIAVENAITELSLKAVQTPREQRQMQYLEMIKQGTKLITAEKIYAYLRMTVPDEEGVNALREYFYGDDHAIWYMSEEEKILRYGGRKEISYGIGEKSDDPDGDSKELQGFPSDGEMESFWKKISEEIQVDLETLEKQKGDQAGGLIQNLNAVNRERYDYASFLAKFAVLGEKMKINDEEFDYIFYSYGFQMYDRMPLIEPLEYKEVKAIKEFVIAIDTSGSTSGDLVQKFVQKTYNILKSTESFFTKMNLHIIQCDAMIQEDVKITCQEDFDAYLKNMQIHGLGGTDFRPVFSYIDSLRQQGELKNLKGMIYFTDGYGDFPLKKPDYETAFVFVEDGYDDPEVPPWAIKLVLQKEEI